MEQLNQDEILNILDDSEVTPIFTASEGSGHCPKCGCLITVHSEWDHDKGHMAWVAFCTACESRIDYTIKPF